MPAVGSQVKMVCAVELYDWNNKITQLGTSVATIITNAVGQNPILIDSLYFANISSSASTFTVRITPITGGADDTTEALAAAEAINANVRSGNLVNGPGPIVLPGGYNLRALAGNASRVNICVSYRTPRNI